VVVSAAAGSRSVDDAEMSLDVRLALVLAVERLAADAAREPPHPGVDRAVAQQRALGREALAALVAHERAVRGQRVSEVARQVGRHVAAVAAAELARAAPAAPARRPRVLGDLLGAQRVLGGAPAALASLHVQRVEHEVALDAAAALRVQRSRVVVHYDVLHLYTPVPRPSSSSSPTVRHEQPASHASHRCGPLLHMSHPRRVPIPNNTHCRPRYTVVKW